MSSEEKVMSRFVSKQKLLVGVLVISSLGIGYALGAQPRMDAALALLQNARAELEAAVPNKGGHRDARSNSSTERSFRSARVLHSPPRTSGDRYNRLVNR